jgi:hypothetical protein
VTAVEIAPQRTWYNCSNRPRHPESAKGIQLDNCDAIVYPRSSFVLHCKRIDLVSYLYIAICLSFPVGTHMIQRNQAPKFPGPNKMFVVWHNESPCSCNHQCFIVRKANTENFIATLFSSVELNQEHCFSCTPSFDQNPSGYCISFNQFLRITAKCHKSCDSGWASLVCRTSQGAFVLKHERELKQLKNCNWISNIDFKLALTKNSKNCQLNILQVFHRWQIEPCNAYIKR